MRVLYITHLTEKNGATLALCNIMEEMVAKGVEVGLIVPSTKGYICDEAGKKGVKLLCNYSYPWALIKGKVSLKGYMLAQWNAYKLIKEFSPHIVHCNTSVIDYSLLGCLLTHTPMVWHAREYIDKYFQQKIVGGMTLHRWLMKLPYVHCVAITKDIFAHFRLNCTKDIVIYDGVIKKANTNKDFNGLHKKTTTRYFLYVGALTEGKGVHVIFEQFANVHKDFSDAELWLACRYDEQSDYYKRCIELAETGNFFDNIKFLGFRTDVYNLMREAVAIIVPSQFEGFGFITVEAMYNGCLVIGHNTAGTKEQFDIGVSQTGEEIGLRYDNDIDLPKLMHRALTEDFSEMKKRAYSVVLANYTICKQNDILYDFYKSLCSNR